MSAASSDPATSTPTAPPLRALAGVAWRGVLNHRRRTGVLVAANALGLVTMALSLGLQRWSHETLLGLTSAGAHGLGHVERPGHHRSRDPALRFPEWPPPIDPARAAELAPRWTAILEWPALVEGPRDQAPVRLEATREGVVADGPAPSESPARPAALVGRASRDLVERLGVAGGARARVRLRDASGEERSVPLALTALAPGEPGGHDRFTITLPLADLQAAVGERSLTSWGIGFDEHASSAAVLAALGRVRAALADPALTVVSWRDTAPDVEGITEVQARATYLLVVILAVVQTIGVANTFVLSLVDRTRELGVLLALGLRPRDLRALIHLEAWLTSALGAAVGAALAVPVAWFLGSHGLDFSGSARSLAVAGQVMPPVIKAYIGPTQVLLGAVLGVIVGPAAGWWPARRIAALDPIAALRAV